MQKRGISQEGLKLIACITMLIDHIGATLVLRYCQYGAGTAWVNAYYAMRMIGRIAFPIYCFLLVEGAYHTQNPKKYALRLFAGMVLSEIPFDLAFSDRIDMESCSVMVTLLLGFLMIEAMKRVKGFWKIVMILPFFLLAEVLRTDYSGNGIMIIAMLALTKGAKQEKWLRVAGFTLLLWFGAAIRIGPVSVPVELLGLIGVPFLFWYDGKKLTHSKAIQWAFYLFYPVHLTVLWILESMIFG